MILCCIILHQCSIFKSLIPHLQIQGIAIFQVIFEDDDHEKKVFEKEKEDFKEDVFKMHDEITCLKNALEKKNIYLAKL